MALSCGSGEQWWRAAVPGICMLTFFLTAAQQLRSVWFWWVFCIALHCRYVVLDSLVCNLSLLRRAVEGTLNDVRWLLAACLSFQAVLLRPLRFEHKHIVSLLQQLAAKRPNGGSYLHPSVEAWAIDIFELTEGVRGLVGVCLYWLEALWQHCGPISREYWGAYASAQLPALLANGLNAYRRMIQGLGDLKEGSNAMAAMEEVLLTGVPCVQVLILISSSGVAKMVLLQVVCAQAVAWSLETRDFA